MCQIICMQLYIILSYYYCLFHYILNNITESMNLKYNPKSIIDITTLPQNKSSLNRTFQKNISPNKCSFLCLVALAVRNRSAPLMMLNEYLHSVSAPQVIMLR